MQTTTRHVIENPEWLGVFPFRMSEESTSNNENTNESPQNPEAPTQQSGSGEEGGVGMPGKKNKGKNVSEDE